MLKSERVILRAIEPKDVDYLYQAENNTDVWKLGATLIPFSKRTLHDYANSIHDLISQKQFRFVIESIETEKVLGLIDLFDYDAINGRAGVGILISKIEDRNSGYAAESLMLLIKYARETLMLNQLYCSIHSSNKGSIRLFEKLNFVQMGLRKNWFKTKNGNWEDEVELQLMLSHEV